MRPIPSILCLLLTLSIGSSFAVAGEKVITIEKIVCTTRETVTGPDEVYFLVNDDGNSVKFNSLEAFKGTKELKNGEEWRLQKSITVKDDAVVVIIVFDRDAGLNDLIQPVFESIAASAKAAGKAQKDPKAAAALTVAEKLAEVFKGIKDQDDDLLLVTITGDERGTNSQSQKKGWVALGTNSEYSLHYSVKEKK